MRIATAWFLSGTLALLGCSSSKKSNAVPDADVSANGCVLDDSKGGDSAIPLQPGVKASGQICPRGDQDFFSIEVGPGMNLLDVNLAYPSSLTKVSLQVRLLQADGITEVPGAVASDTNPNDGKSAVVTTFAIPQPGSYVLRVSDASNAAADNANIYVLQVALATDPDTHEPNGTAAQAKAADGLPGFISFVGDSDVYAVTLAASDAILAFQVNNPAAAKAVLTYQIADSTGRCRLPPRLSISPRPRPRREPCSSPSAMPRAQPPIVAPRQDIPSPWAAGPRLTPTKSPCAMTPPRPRPAWRGLDRPAQPSSVARPSSSRRKPAPLGREGIAMFSSCGPPALPP
jgi:hypothetical protein